MATEDVLRLAQLAGAVLRRPARRRSRGIVGPLHRPAYRMNTTVLRIAGMSPPSTMRAPADPATFVMEGVGHDPLRRTLRPVRPRDILGKRPQLRDRTTTIGGRQPRLDVRQRLSRRRGQCIEFVATVGVERGEQVARDIGVAYRTQQRHQPTQTAIDPMHRTPLQQRRVRTEERAQTPAIRTRAMHVQRPCLQNAAPLHDPIDQRPDLRLQQPAHAHTPIIRPCPTRENGPMTAVTMYSTTWCGYCHRLKSQLDREGIAYQVIDIEQTPGAAEIVEAVNNGNQTVPTLVYADGSAQTNPSVAQVKAKLAAL